MNFKISKRIFYNALQTVARAISPNSPLPALSGIKIEVDQHSAYRESYRWLGQRSCSFPLQLKNKDRSNI